VIVMQESLIAKCKQVQAAVRQAQLRKEKEQRIVNRALASK
jgi:hypothetical protein